MKWALFPMLLLTILGPGPRQGNPVDSAPQAKVAVPSATRYTVPDGFTVEVAAPAEKTGSIVACTFDSRGRPVLSRERGPVLILEDRDSNGDYETFLTFTETVKNCQGLYFWGNDLFAVGDGPAGTGLYRVYDRDGDSAGDETVLITKFAGSMGEHGPHSVFFGPDGFLYADIGNHAGIVPTPDPLSPHRDYYEGQLLPSYFDARGHARQIRAPGGTIFRLDPEGRSWSLFAGGFRNQYDSAFNDIGELFTWDSDMEWDIGLPWYRPVRTNHIVPGGEYGWRTGSGKWPDYYIDNLPAMAEQGRGSPVGVEFYLHHVYPEKYRNAFILGDWSRGRILMGFLKRDGATYKEVDEDFVLGEPINVTDLEIGPDGFLYFVTGGRNTEGGLYRVAYRGAAAPPPSRRGIQAALRQPQHRSAWGRTRLMELQKEMGRRWSRELEDVIDDSRMPAIQRVRALELLQVYGPAPRFERLAALGKDPAWEVRAASTYYLGMHNGARARAEIARRLRDPDPFVRRRACEALVRAGLDAPQDPGFDVVRDLLPLLGDGDRWVRFAAAKAIQRTNRNLWRDSVLEETRPLPAIEGMLALVQSVRGTNDTLPLLRKSLELLKTGLSHEDLLRLLRVLHLTITNDAAVERPQLYQEMGQILLAKFPASDSRVSWELARSLAYLQTKGAVQKILLELERPGLSRSDQIFYAYCLRNIKSEWTEADQKRIVAWFAKTQTERWRGGASFVGFLENIWKSWLSVLPFSDQGNATALLAKLAPPPSAGGEIATSFTRRTDTGALSDQELSEYLLWDPMAYRGTAVDGLKLYQKALCANCHLFNGVGYEAAPDLSDIGKRFKRKDLVEAIIYPDKIISDLWAAVEITTVDGSTLMGNIVGEDAQQVVLSQIGGKTEIPLSKIKSRRVSKKSMMPAGLLDHLSLREVVSLITFLEKGPSR